MPGLGGPIDFRDLLWGALGFTNGLIGIAGTLIVTGIGSGIGSTISQGLDPCTDITLTQTSIDAGVGVLGGLAAAPFVKTNVFNSFKQLNRFGPRTLKGFIPKQLGAKAGTNAMNAVYKSGGLGAATGFLAGYAQQ